MSAPGGISAPCFAERARVSGPGRDAVDAEVFAREGRLHVDGARVDFLHAYATDRIAGEDEPNTVRVVGERLARVLDIGLPTTRLAERLLASLRVDGMERALTLEAGRASMSWLLLMLMPIVTIVSAAIVSMALHTPALGLVGFFVPAVVLLAARRKKRRLVVDGAGLTIHDLITRQRVDFAIIENVLRVGDTGLQLGLYPEAPHGGRPAFADADLMKDGWVHHVPREPVRLEALEPEAREALYFMLLQRRAAANRAAELEENPPSSRAPAPETAEDASLADATERLALRGRDGTAWLAALAALAPRNSYREHPPTDDELVAVARDLDVDVSARLGAMMLLRRRGADAPAVHLDERTPPAVANAARTLIEAVEQGSDLTAAADELAKASG